MTRNRFVRASAAALLFACAARPSTGQDSRPDSRSADDPVVRAEAAIAAIDARAYSPVEAGLKRLQFSYAPSATEAALVDFRVRLAWSVGEEPKVDFLDLEKRPLDRSIPNRLLDAPDPERAGKTLEERYVAGAKAFLKLAFAPPTYAERFKDWRKRLESSVVNGREERTIVCEPIASSPFRRVEIRIGQDGMPERLKQFLTRPENGSDVVVTSPVYEAVGDRMLMTSYKEEVAGRVDQIVIEYRKIDGVLVPATYERIVTGSKLGGSKTVFDEVSVETKAP